MCIPLEWTPATKGLKGATRATSALRLASVREEER